MLKIFQPQSNILKFFSKSKNSFLGWNIFNIFYLKLIYSFFSLQAEAKKLQTRFIQADESYLKQMQLYRQHLLQSIALQNLNKTCFSEEGLMEIYRANYQAIKQFLPGSVNLTDEEVLKRYFFVYEFSRHTLYFTKN